MALGHRIGYLLDTELSFPVLSLSVLIAHPSEVAGADAFWRLCIHLASGTRIIRGRTIHGKSQVGTSL